MGIALVMGENIGTTATANLAALGAGTEARRAALAHLLFNVFGVIWVLVVFYPFVDMVCGLVGYNPSMAGQTERIPIVLAMFHTCFNVLNTALLIGLIPQMEQIVCKLLPEGKAEAKQPVTLHFINSGVMQTAEIAEFSLLHLLLVNRGKVLSRQQLMDSVWAGVVVTDRTVNVNITRLRKKIGPYAQNIVSRTGFGYVFED